MALLNANLRAGSLRNGWPCRRREILPRESLNDDRPLSNRAGIGAKTLCSVAARSDRQFGEAFAKFEVEFWEGIGKAFALVVKERGWIAKPKRDLTP